MKQPGKTILKLGNVLISVLLSLLGFNTACNTDEMKFLYGTPFATADFLVTGKVINETNNKPIENIKVKTVFDSTYTDSNGRYAVTFYGTIGTGSILVQYIDIDGKANDEFQQLDKNVDFIDPVFSGGDGDLYRGVTIKNVNVNLTEKK
jgi:putative lipoprotein (rSAM/lipoprotein system)